MLATVVPFSAFALAGVGIAMTVSALSGTRATIADAVVVYDRSPPTFGAPEQETRRNHGSRYRTDARVRLGKTNEFWNLQVFNSPGQPSSFKIYRREDGSPASLSVQQDDLSGIPQPAATNFTGTTETHLGEKCRVWRIAHKVRYGSDFVQSGCVTRDGVFLWSRQADVDTVIARKILRRHVLPADVRVPVELMDIRSWTKDIHGQSHTNDYEVVFGPSKNSYSAKQDFRTRHVERRSGSWTYTADESEGKITDITLMNINEGLSLMYSARGNRVLNISKRPLNKPARDFIRGKVRDTHRASESVLGERCMWWDMMPGVNDVGQFNCITQDGITLKIQHISIGVARTIEAISVRRSPQPIGAVLPKNGIISPATWGL